MENNVKEKNNSKGVIILLCIIIIILLALCTLFATGKISLKDNTNNAQSNNNVEMQTEDNVTTNNVTGEYTVEVTNLKAQDENNSATLTLSLYDNGIFTYTYSQYASYGTLGNYVIEGNKIVLTTWFNTDSGTGLRIAKGSKTLIISNDGTIIDNDIKVQTLVDNNISAVTLIKTNKEIKSYDINNQLNAACLNGECGNNSTDAAI